MSRGHGAARGRLFLFGALIIFLGITRLVIQTGIHYFTTPMTAQGLTLAITGTGVGPHNLIALALCYAWCGDVQSTFMPSAAHATKLLGLYQHRRSLGLTFSLGLAVVVSFVASSALILYLCYDYGAGNLRSWSSTRPRVPVVSPSTRWCISCDIRGLPTGQS